MQKVEIEVTDQLAMQLDELGIEHNHNDLPDIIIAELEHSIEKRDEDESRGYRD
jgi:hypothetical protein